MRGLEGLSRNMLRICPRPFVFHSEFRTPNSEIQKMVCVPILRAEEYCILPVKIQFLAYFPVYTPVVALEYLGTRSARQQMPLQFYHPSEWGGH
jgi:hypothetical protein